MFLKSDTQEFERTVLKGAKSLLSRLWGIQLELPIVHVYQGTWTLPQAIEYMHENGFVISQIHPASFLLRDDKVSLWEIDVTFRRFNPAMDR
jgi:hypothetical protein